MPDPIRRESAVPQSHFDDANTAPAATASRRQSARDDIVVVAMNEGGRQEVEALRRFAHVDAIANQKTGPLAALVQPEDVADFVATLKLPPAQAAGVASALQMTEVDARDELAQLAQRWAKVEQGAPAPGRLLLSGHSIGDQIFGEENGSLSFDAIGELARAMPKAAAGVEDLHVAACYTGSESQMARYADIFPNVKTIWAYEGSAPGSASGALVHEQKWERATRGSVNSLSRDGLSATRKGENVAVWSRAGGYSNGVAPPELEQARATVERGLPVLSRYQQGLDAVSDPQRGPLRDWYSQLQGLINHPELPPAERREWQSQRDQAIRLLYYSSSVAPRFAARYGETLSRGYAAVGRQVPDFAQMPRREALEEVARFERALAAVRTSAPQARAALDLMQRGLRDLDPGLIPVGWL